MNTMLMQVSEGLSVTILPDSQHEFLMTTQEVANGYGVSEANIRKHKQVNSDEFIEGKHFLACVSNTHAGCKSDNYEALPPVKHTLWTKRGIVRLGFFIKSKQAKVFRDWAEDLIINKLSRPVEGTISFQDKEFLSKEEYCIAYSKTTNSFNGLLAHYPAEFLFVNAVWHISTDLCKKVALKIEETRLKHVLQERNRMAIEERKGNQLSLFEKGGAV